jgi:hypothetical protein
MKDEVLQADKVPVVSKQLIGFINNEVVNPKGEFFYNGKINELELSSSSS